MCVGITGALYFLNAVGAQNVCTDALVAGSGHAVKLCGQPDLLALAPFVLMIGLLLWPDLSELSIGQLITLKRRVKEQELRQEAVETRLTQLNMNLAQFAQGQGQGQAQHISQNFYGPNQDDVKRGIGDKATLVDRTQPEPQLADKVETQEEREDRAALLGEFLLEYSKLEPYVSGQQPRFAQDQSLNLSPDQAAEVMWFNSLFKQEIEAVRQTRNIVLHQPELVTSESIRGATDNTRELLRILLKRIGRPLPASQRSADHGV
jgi:hypothetical protein